MIILVGIGILVLGVMALDTFFAPFCVLSHFDRGAKMKFYTAFWGILAPTSVLVFGQQAHDAAGVFAALGSWSWYNWHHLAHHA